MRNDYFSHNGHERLGPAETAESYEQSVPFPTTFGQQLTSLGRQHKAKERPWAKEPVLPWEPEMLGKA